MLPALNSANYAALIYNTLLQRIKTSPKFPANSPSTYSSVSANYRNCSDDDGDSDDNDEKNDDDDGDDVDDGDDSNDDDDDDDSNDDADDDSNNDDDDDNSDDDDDDEYK